MYNVFMHLGCQCYLQDIDLELAALEDRDRQVQLSAFAELDAIAEEDDQEPPGMILSHHR